ncbi:MAG: response regulator transcription factor [Brevinematia bacterium]
MLKILLIYRKDEDVEELKASLKYEGYEVTVEENAQSAFDAIKKEKFAGVIIDIDSVGEDAGFEFIKKARKQDFEVILITLCSSKSLQDKIYVLNIGADDYIEKPFYEDEVIARLKAHIRKVSYLKEGKNLATIVYSTDSEAYVTIGKARVYFDKMLIKFDDEEVYLTNKEASILQLLYKNRGKVVSRETMMKEIWGGEGFITERVIDTNIVSIRKKLKDTGERPKYIKSVFGTGYKLMEEE